MYKALWVLMLATPASVLAAKPCGVITHKEASQLLGAFAVKETLQRSEGASSQCIVHAVRDARTMLTIDLRTVAADDAEHLRAHTDEERGDEIQSLHDEPWYEVSVIDAAHPHDRRLVIHRNRTLLTLDVHTDNQTKLQTVFENLWPQIAERLSADQS